MVCRWFITYLGDLQPTYIYKGSIIHLLSTMDVQEDLLVFVDSKIHVFSRQDDFG